MQQRAPAVDYLPSFLARWTSRIAPFLAVLLAVALFLHRVFGLPTPVLMQISSGVFAGAAIVLVMAVVAGIDIWITGRQGTSHIVFGAMLALALLAIPASLYALSRQWPLLNDVTTDVAKPPDFASAPQTRQPGSNPLTYPAAEFASLQKTAYPDIKPIIVPRSADECFELILQAVAKLRMKTIYEAPPESETDAPGIVEIADKTLIFGFQDDVIIRVADEDNGARIDVRSASRYGASDFGRNAQRVRDILKEIVGRLEASVPNAESLAKAQRARQEQDAKQRKGRDPASAANRSKRGPAQSDARRAPQRKASPQE